MAVRVDIPKLYALADALESLEKDIRTLSNGAVSSANNVLGRVVIGDYAPLKTACTKATNNVKQTKDLTTSVCAKLTQQVANLRSAAQSYRAKDTIGKVN